MLDRILIGSSAEPTDTNFKNVTLLLHGDGSNGAQNNTFLDSSTNNFTITRNGNTTQGSFSPYGSNWSNYFDGSGDYLSAPSNAAFDCGTGDWTIECWVYISTRTNSYPVVFGNNRGGWTTDALALTNSNADNAAYNDKFVFGWNNGGFTSPSAGTSQLLVANATNSNNTWYHFAVVRNGTSIKMYRNGAEVASATISSGASFNWGYNGALVGGGNWDGAGSYFNGYISNLRVLKGTALYTSTFTPSTTPLTAITNTSLLTCQSNRFRDGSTNNFTITRNGDVKVTNFAPFAPSAAYSTSVNGGSAYFDGTGDYLTTPNNAAFAFGTGDYTIELWINTNADAGNVIDFRVGGNLTPYPAIYLSGGGVFFWPGTGSDGVSVGSYTKNAWVHLAVSRSGSSLKFFVNGVQTYSASDTTNLSQGTVTIGARWDAGNLFAGYISNFRVVKGTAVYTAAFTPPTAPVTAITNTSLLTNFTNAAIFDNSMKNDLETVGNAQISTSVKKFGTGSIYVPSGGGCALIPNSQPLTLGTGNWTIEFWAYTDASGTKVYMDLLNVANTVIYGEMYSIGTTLYWYRDGSNFITGTGALTANTWQHIAVAKSGTSTKLFVNGTQVGSTLTDSFDYASARWEIGGRSNLTLPIVGYIDDLRITNGVARYTANFTAPTAPFPNK